MSSKNRKKKKLSKKEVNRRNTQRGISLDVEYSDDGEGCFVKATPIKVSGINAYVVEIDKGGKNAK